MVQTRKHGFDKDSWYRNRLMVQTWTHGIDMDSWYRHGLMVYTWTHGIEMDSWYRHGLMVQTLTYGIDMDSWYIHGLMVQTLTHDIGNTNGIVWWITGGILLGEWRAERDWHGTLKVWLAEAGCWAEFNFVYLAFQDQFVYILIQLTFWIQF